MANLKFRRRFCRRDFGRSSGSHDFVIGMGGKLFYIPQNHPFRDGQPRFDDDILTILVERQLVQAQRRVVADPDHRSIHTQKEVNDGVFPGAHNRTGLDNHFYLQFLPMSPVA